MTIVNMNLDNLKPISQIIKSVSDKWVIDESLISAFIIQESNGNTWANRLEIEYWKNNKYHLPNIYAKNLGISLDTEKVNQSMSWGLMQMMGVLAREIGFDGPLTKLCDAQTGLYWSCKHLDSLILKYKNIEDVIASWNHGSPEKILGKYVNQSYVDSVMAIKIKIATP